LIGTATSLDPFRSGFIQIHRSQGCILFQQDQRRHEDALVLVGITGMSQGQPALKLRKGRPWRCGAPGDACAPAGQGGRHPGQFEGPCDQSHGLSTQWSGRYQQGHMGFFSRSRCKDARDRFMYHPDQIGMEI
jgi:hypothetical protein